ncbi:MAG: D-glycero-beta-D-manno-heptose 1-phosphate adenylyltransferase [Fusobacteria bacterium]|nr:D-glycero-beta-D-manno-heptose 1-phosphate adenylyltransferase [Fusobacteriota bacterium]
MDKLLEKEEMAKIISNLKNGSKKVVFTNGCFDILHIGHTRYLDEAKKKGDILVVGLNSDKSVRSLKGELKPYVPEEERAEMLLSLKSVDYVVIFDEDNPISLIDTLKPSVHVKGGDYTKESLIEAEVVEKNGGVVEIVSLVAGKSTTNIIEKVLEKNKV